MAGDELLDPLKFKVVLVGNSGCGKSCLLTRMRTREFRTSSSTLGDDFYTVHVDVRRQPVQLHVWDTAGQERFRSVMPQYLRGSSAVLVVYSIADEESFLSVPEWLAEVRKSCEEHVKVVLVGAKSDLVAERQVDEERGRRFTINEASAFFETSAKTGANVEAMFEAVGASLLDHHMIWKAAKKEGADETLKLHHQQQEQKLQQERERLKTNKCC